LKTEFQLCDFSFENVLSYAVKWNYIITVKGVVTGYDSHVLSHNDIGGSLWNWPFTLSLQLFVNWYHH